VPSKTYFLELGIVSRKKRRCERDSGGRSREFIEDGRNFDGKKDVRPDIIRGEGSGIS
jgi:hypothetical protein